MLVQRSVNVAELLGLRVEPRQLHIGRAAVQRLADLVGVDQVDVLERDRPGRGRPPSSATPPDVEAGVVAAVMVGASLAPVMVTVTSG